jgi:putative ABC transport system substrate-binding protein
MSSSPRARRHPGRAASDDDAPRRLRRERRSARLRFVQSLSRPGGNVTGVSSVGADLSYKYLEFLRDRDSMPVDGRRSDESGSPGPPDYLRNIQTAAREAVRILPIHAANVGQIEAAFA